ncbi:MAG: tryptophan synthase subunit alpha [Gammaproteobacteria bacterium]
MSRLTARFEQLQAQSRKALIPYIMTSDPQPEVTLPLMHAMVKAGADIIELGAPFSDPMADGPVIQLAAERALEHNTSLHDVFKVVQQFRQTDPDTPIIMMGYLNPIEVMGYESFAAQAESAGIDGIITVDMPPEEGSDYVAALKQHNIDPVFLLAPTTTEARMDKIAAAASGFAYYVSLKGVTGAATLNIAEVAEKMTAIRKHIKIPVGVGFGIKDAATAASISACADAVVVGSAIVTRMAENSGNTDKIITDVTEILASMRNAMDAAGASKIKTA